MKKTGHLTVLNMRDWKGIPAEVYNLGVLSKNDTVWRTTLRMAATDMPP